MPVFFSRERRTIVARFVAVLTMLLFLCSNVTVSNAQSTTRLTGTVTAAGAPVAKADVVVTGGNLTLRTQTDAKGRFTFSGIPLGTYTVDVTSSSGVAATRVDVASAGADVTLAVAELKEIGRSAVASHPPLRGSGTDVTVTGELLTRSPANGNLGELLVQLPGAARGANGVVHINGDHGDINYIVDGAPVPQELNRSIGSEIDPNDISFVEILQGAYSAQYGERFASVLNVSTRNGGGPPGFTGDLRAGSYGFEDSTLGYHLPVGPGSLVAAFRNQRNSRFLDPPDFDSPHNAGSSSNEFLRYTLPHGNDFFNITVSHTYQTYQIPPDVAAGAPANTDDTETQDDLFVTARYRHAIGDHGSLSFGPNYKRSHILDLGDPVNDFHYGQALNPGASTDCANALLPGSTVANPQPDQTINYVNGSCGYSLFGDRTAIDVGGNIDYDLQSGRHDIRAGALYDATHVAKNYAVTLQPGNFLAPLFSGNPTAAYTVVDNAPNVGHLTAAYLQDTWRMGDRWQLDYGLRADVFKVVSTEFAAGTSQTSPRVKLTHFFNPRDSIYAYYGRFFTPFSLENVSPASAQLLNLPLQTSVAAFDLKPQRDSVYELGGHIGLGKGDLGIRVMQKNATDLIDDTQVGVTNLHQDINYALGRIATQTAYYQYPLARAGRFYASVSHTYSVNKGCETQLLAPCFGSSTDWTPSDHDQRYDVTSGLLLNDRHGGWFALDGEYGSGLSSNTCPVTDVAPCKRTPHLTFDTEKAFPLPRGMALTARIGNIFNDRYYVTIGNAQGTHFARPRTFDLGLRFNTR